MSTTSTWSSPAWGSSHGTIWVGAIPGWHCLYLVDPSGTFTAQGVLWFSRDGSRSGFGNTMPVDAIYYNPHLRHWVY